ncbi:MAG: glycosyltransferase family 4 protein [Ignavibacteria bacterium]
MEHLKPKIIHILSIQPNAVCLNYNTPEEYIIKHDNAEYILIDKHPYWVGFFEDFHHKIAVETLKRTDRYEIECWRPYWNFIKKPFEKNFEGVIHKVFPSIHYRIPKLIEGLWSPMFHRSLRKELEINRQVLLHIHDGHSDFITNLLLNLKPLQVPIVYQHRGSWMYNFDYKFRLQNPISLLLFRKQKRRFNYIDYYLSGSKFEYEYIRNILGFSKVSYFMDGIDFNYFRPGNKMEVRKKLGLPIDKNIILYVGRFDKANGLDILIRVYQWLKQLNFNVELLLVGGYKTNELYEVANSSGAIIVERVPEPKLLDYYQASDIYVMAIEDYLYRTFGGIGTATLQALACGVPVLTYNILNFPAPENEIKKVGRTFLTEEDLYQNASYMLTHLDEFKECRDITKKYYDINVTMKNLLSLYDKLFTQYYG